jgi:transaldolase / glucose-6-phosphate isomerase
MNNPLKSIRALGQSVWYDNLSRELVRTGELTRMIEEDGVSGLTSNPSILDRALNSERIYDVELHHLVDAGRTVQEIYENLVTADVREAADLLYPIYENSCREDGYVSLEVSPHVAYDTAGTIDQAKHLWTLVDRRNLLIKVPATPEGLLAVQELIAQGININVTLIFSLDQYRDAATAYIEGLERWVADGGDPRVPTSIASLFVSRLDTAIDQLLREIVDPRMKSAARNLLGKAAIANARMAYATYKEIFHGAHFAPLRRQEARLQKLVWASTSTKDPDYPDTLYVDALIGPETINTLPKIALDAYRHHGRPTPRLEEGIEAAFDVFPRLEQLGIGMDDVTDSLLENGVKQFADSFDQLLQGIAKKRTRLVRGWGHRAASLGDTLQSVVDEKLSQLDKERIGERIWTGDVSLWTDDPELRSAVVERMGWLTAVETMKGETRRLCSFADEIRTAGFKVGVLLGMGGSSLSAEVFSTCFPVMEGFLRVKVLDTTLPAAILDAAHELDPEHTLFLVCSKSGATVEVLSLFHFFWNEMERALGKATGSHFVAITDPGTGLGKLASSKGFRRTFLNPPDIGGRFSALSYFGLVPAALMGLDVDRLLMRAAQAVEASTAQVPALENQGLWLGTCMAEASVRGRDKLSLVVSPGITSFGGWLEQLLAESTGKEGKGILPIEGEPLGSPEAYGGDRLFVYLRLDDQGEYDAEVSALEQAGHPVITLRLHSPYDLGRETFRWQLATAIAGAILQINPFDEPNVMESKDITRNILQAYRRGLELPEGERLDVTDPSLISVLRDFLATARPGHYVAFLAYVRSTAENQDILRNLRTLVRDRYRMATTVGMGPRYLHSTGQLHKGGPDKGLFIQITTDDVEDVAIPGESYSFGVLKFAQAIGDYHALKTKGRRIMRIHLPSEADLAKLVEIFNAVVG